MFKDGGTAVNGQTTVTTVLEGKEPINDAPHGAVNKIVKKTYKNHHQSQPRNCIIKHTDCKIDYSLLAFFQMNQSSKVLFGMLGD